MENMNLLMERSVKSSMLIHGLINENNSNDLVTLIEMKLQLMMIQILL